MKKVITVNLADNAYQVDEDGYERLRRYLQDAAWRLRSNADKNEVIADLERAIGEKFTALLRPQKTVITLAEVEQILNDIGPVESIEGEAPKANFGSGRQAGGQSQSASDFYAPKQLHRLSENKMIAGVCSGIAAYFGFDVTVVRVVFALLGFFSAGFWIVVYIVMVILVPVAHTDQQRAAAHGVHYKSSDAPLP